MNNLIQKAIKAIQEGKMEYAVGLLEGVLELSGVKLTPANILSPMPMPYVKTPDLNQQFSRPLNALQTDVVSGLESTVSPEKIAELKKLSGDQQ